MSTCPSGPRASASCSVHLPPIQVFRGAAAGTFRIHLKDKVEDLGSSVNGALGRRYQDSRQRATQLDFD